MASYGNLNSRIDFGRLPDPTPYYELLETIGEGTYGEVYIAKSKATGGKVAIKILEISSDILEEIEEEYLVLTEYGSQHPNLPIFHGVYLKSGPHAADQLWFVLELCSGGSVTDLVKKLLEQQRKLDEDVIGYVLMNTLEALAFLHGHNVIHRDIKGQNILLTEAAKIVLVDFGVSAHLRTSDGRRNTSVGTPYFMAPEVIACEQQLDSSYDARADIWSLGIVAIELADGEPPHANLHPMRSPSPTVNNPSEWSAVFMDFIRQCLIKDCDKRPTPNQLLRHPFITRLPPNLAQVQSKLRNLLCTLYGPQRVPPLTPSVIAVTTKRGKLKTHRRTKSEVVYGDDLAALEVLDETIIVDHIYHRYVKDQIYTYVGDILIAINPFAPQSIYTEQMRKRYCGCSKSDNVPHIYGMSDTSYHSMLQYAQNQCTVISGESGSGKTESAKHLIQHLAYLGRAADHVLEQKLLSVNPIMEAFGNARTGINDNSSRFGKYLEMVFSATGRVIRAKLSEYLLEKGRVVHQAPLERNFHIFYLIYDGLGRPLTQLEDSYGLRPNHTHRYLGGYISDDPATVAFHRAAFMELDKNLNTLGFKAQELTALYRILAAILHLGDVQFSTREVKHMTDQSAVSNNHTLETVSRLLGVDFSELRGALTTEMVVTRGETIMRAHSVQEARNVRDSLAKALYGRLFDFVVNKMNNLLLPTDNQEKDQNTIGILDIFGFENFESNSFEQLCINVTNEQLQYFFNHSVFTWEQKEYAEEGLDWNQITFCDNRPVLDLFLSKPVGLLGLLDEESRFPKATDHSLAEKFHYNLKSSPCYYRNKVNVMRFSVDHYAGKIEYDVHGFLEKNRDYLATEVIRLMRTSDVHLLRLLFHNPLTKTGNLYEADAMTDLNGSTNTCAKNGVGQPANAPRLPNMSHDNKRLRTLASQTRAHQTLAIYFRYSLTDLLTKIVASNPQFIRCIKPNDQKLANFFCGTKVRTQLAYTGVLETAKIRRQGYPCRIPFAEFLRRYAPIVYRFDINLPPTSDSCRSLLHKLRLEGWAVGKTKVFIKYYHMDYLSKLLKKLTDAIILIQAGICKYLARKRYAAYCQLRHHCATTIQKVYRGWKARKAYITLKSQRLERSRLQQQSSRKRPCETSPLNSIAPLKHRSKSQNPPMSKQSAGQEIIAEIRQSKRYRDVEEERAKSPRPSIRRPALQAVENKSHAAKETWRRPILEYKKTDSLTLMENLAPLEMAVKPSANEKRPRVRDFIAVFEKGARSNSASDASSDGAGSRGSSWRQNRPTSPVRVLPRTPCTNVTNQPRTPSRASSFQVSYQSRENHTSVPSTDSSREASFASAAPKRQPPPPLPPKVTSFADSADCSRSSNGGVDIHTTVCAALSHECQTDFRSKLRKSNWDPAQTLSRTFLPVGQVDFRSVLRNGRK